MILYLNEVKNACIHLILAGRNRARLAQRYESFEEGTDYKFFPFDAATGKAPQVAADYIIHGAGRANPAAFSEEPVETMVAHFAGTKAMLELARQTGAKRILYISSSEVYGTRDNGDEPYREDDYGYVDISNPRACYPCVKRAAETLCAAYGAEYGVDAVIVRPGHIYGPFFTPSDDRAVSQFIRNALTGRDIVMKSSGAQMRSYCYCLDCAAAILTVLLRGKTGEAYNISNARSLVAIRDVANALAKECGVSIIFERPSYAEQKSYNMMGYSCLDASKLEALGWTAQFDLTDGIKSCVRAKGGGT